MRKSRGGLSVKEIIKNVSNFITGTEKTLPSSFTKLFKKYPTQKITKIILGSNPINSAVQSVLNAATVGAVEKRLQELGADKLRHLYFIVELEGNKFISFEKNQTLKAMEGFLEPDRQMEVFLPPGFNRTFPEFMEVALRGVGPKRILVYTAHENNCQQFVLDVLKSNGLLFGAEGDRIKTFVKQDVAKIFSPFLKNLGFSLPKLAHFFDLFT